MYIWLQSYFFHYLWIFPSPLLLTFCKVQIWCWHRIWGSRLLHHVVFWLYNNNPLEHLMCNQKTTWCNNYRLHFKFVFDNLKVVGFLCLHGTGSTDHEVTHLLWNSKVRYCVHKSLPLDHTLSHMNLALTPCFFKIHFPFCCLGHARGSVHVWSISQRCITDWGWLTF